MKPGERYLLEESDIIRKQNILVGKHFLDKSLKKFYDGKSSHGRTLKPLILMDTSALLKTTQAKLFIRDIAPSLARRGENLVIPISVMAELRNLSERLSSPVVSLKAEEMLAYVMHYWRHGIISIYDNEDDEMFADEQFQILALMFSRHYRVIVISQDSLLGQDLLTMSRLKSVEGRHILVKRLREDGMLESVKWAGASYLEPNEAK